MTHDRKQLGKEGEARAVQFLKQQGLSIVETNFSTRFAEIDIIALDRPKGLLPGLFRDRSRDCLCFVEVKTRSSLKAGRPAEAVHTAKQQKIIQAAQAYLQAHPHDEGPVRFDVIEVIRHRDEWEIRHIPHAFQTH